MFDFLLPILSVVIGLFFAVWFLESKTFNLKLLLTFSGAFLLSTTVFELLPDVYKNLDQKIYGSFYPFGYYSTDNLRILFKRCRTRTFTSSWRIGAQVSLAFIFKLRNTFFFGRISYICSRNYCLWGVYS